MSAVSFDLLSPVELTIPQGRSRTYELTFQDDSGNTIDLTGATVYFTVRKTLGGSILITKVSTNVLNIAILDQTQPATKGKADVYLQPVDTKNLPASEYIYDLVVVTSLGKIYQGVAPSPFVVSPVVTVLP